MKGVGAKLSKFWLCRRLIINRYFTYRRDGRCEELLSEALTALAADLAADPILCRLKAVVLGGGYGRGEGGCTIAGKPYNDLDFFVFLGDEAENGELRNKLQALSDKWHKSLGIDVDFFVVPGRKWLKNNIQTLMVQELLAGHRVIYGSESFLTDYHRYKWSELPWEEGARLLINRGTGLLLSCNKKVSGDFVMRNIHKAALGCGDALLIASASYAGSGDERLKNLESNADFKLYLDSYRQGLAFKYEPMIMNLDVVNLDKNLNDQLVLWKQGVCDFVYLVTKQRRDDALDAALVLLKSASVSWGSEQKLRNILLNGRWCSQMGFGGPWTEHPRLKLLPLLIKALREPERAEEYLALWERLN